MAGSLFREATRIEPRRGTRYCRNYPLSNLLKFLPVGYLHDFHVRKVFRRGASVWGARTGVRGPRAKQSAGGFQRDMKDGLQEHR